MSQNNLQYDIQISSSELNREELNRYTKLDHVSNSTIIEEAQFETLIGIEELPAPLKTQIEENHFTLEDGKYPYYVTLHALDQESFQAYAKQVSLWMLKILPNKTHQPQLSLTKFPMKFTHLRKK